MDTEVKNIIDKIVSKFNPDKIIMFGSFVTGLQTKDSDLDLLIVMDSELPPATRENRKSGWGASPIRYHLIFLFIHQLNLNSGVIQQIIY
jgi:hypothetical protein